MHMYLHHVSWNSIYLLDGGIKTKHGKTNDIALEYVFRPEVSSTKTMDYEK